MGYVAIMVSSLLVVALAGAVAAFTPPGFAPASANNLAVAYGTVLAMNGVVVPKAGKISCLLTKQF